MRWLSSSRIAFFLFLIPTILFAGLLLGSDQATHTIKEYLKTAPIEEYARFYFSQSIEHWGEGDYNTARQYIDLAFEKPMYPMDIPKLWYFTAKMDIETGNVSDAIQNLEKVIFLEPDRTEILILLRSLRSLREMASLKNPVLGLDYFSETFGFVKFIEFFYNPIASERYLDELYILDRANRFVFGEGKNGSYVIDLPFSSPSGLVIDSTAGKMVLSDLAEGKLHRLDLRTRQWEELYDGFSKPFVRAVDRMGNLYVLDPPKNVLTVLSASGRVIRNIFLSSGYTPNLVTDVDVDFDLLVLQDLTLKSYRILHIPTYEEMYLIPFVSGKIPVSTCCDGMGNIITLWNSGELTYRDAKNSAEGDYLPIDLTNIELEGISDLDYCPPLLTFTDFDDHLVKSYVLARTNSEAINFIDGMYIEGDHMHIFFRNRHISGKEFGMNGPFISISDSGGLVPFNFEYIWKPVTLFRIENGSEFFDRDLQNLSKNVTNVLLWKYDGYEMDFDNAAPALLAKNAKLYVLSNLTVSSDLNKLARLTGGMVLSPDYLPIIEEYYRGIPEMPFSFISYRMTIPFEGVKIVTVSSRIAGMDYSDSVYYTIYMVPEVKESLINSLAP